MNQLNRRLTKVIDEIDHEIEESSGFDWGGQHRPAGWYQFDGGFRYWNGQRWQGPIVNHLPEY